MVFSRVECVDTGVCVTHGRVSRIIRTTQPACDARGVAVCVVKSLNPKAPPGERRARVGTSRRHARSRRVARVLTRARASE